MRVLCILLSVCLFLSSTPFPAAAKEGEKLIALTFDDGPHPTQTDKILAVLDKYGVKATFFVIGINALRYPEVLARVVEGGHFIGNHTYTHTSLYRLSNEELKRELERTERILQALCKIKVGLFRPPEGYRGSTVDSLCAELGYKAVYWSVDTRDWSGASAADIEKRIVSGVKNGAVVLCHDYISRASNTAEALDRVIPRLLQEGYSFVGCEELLERGEK